MKQEIKQEVKDLPEVRAREVYVAPAIEVIEMETEGILCGSGGSGDDYNSGGGIGW